MGFHFTRYTGPKYFKIPITHIRGVENETPMASRAVTVLGRGRRAAPPSFLLGPTF